MAESRSIKILAFVGLIGSGKTTATEHLVELQHPRVSFTDHTGAEVAREINDLANAGQHTAVVDGLISWTDYKLLKHEFPGEMTVIAIVTPKHLRHQRMANRSERPMAGQEVEERDWAEIENLEKGGPIAIADHYIINDGDLEKLHAQIDAELRSINF